jgi:hypothetical protein
MPSVKVAALFEIGSDNWEFTTTVATGSKDWLSLGTAFNAAVVDNLLPVLGSDCTFFGSQWADYIEKDTGGEFVPAAADSVGGAGLSLPPSVAATVTLRIPAYGKGKQGRWFLAGVPQEGYVVGELEPDYRVSLQAAVDAFIAALAGAAIQPLVAHFGKPADGRPFLGTDIVSRAVVRTRLGGQRRRAHGVNISGRGGGSTP